VPASVLRQGRRDDGGCGARRTVEGMSAMVSCAAMFSSEPSAKTCESLGHPLALGEEI
jgi:hypothetical protein